MPSSAAPVAVHERVGRPTEPAPDRRRLAAVLLGALPLVVAYHATQIRALPGDALGSDLDIQYTLARWTAQGAVPLIDFEHGWNTASWYFGGLLYRLADGNVTLWTFLWWRVTAGMLAGVALLAIAWRLRLRPMWAAVLVPTWMLVAHVPNGKYAVPMLWCLTLLPVGVLRRPGVAQALRVGLVATIFWFHVELAVLLGAGTAMYDAFGARGLPSGERVRRVLGVGAGLLIGFGTQALVYRQLGLAPGELAAQLLFSQVETEAANYGYPLLAPSSFRTLVWPATLLLPFVPLLWRRLSDPTRYVAFLHLGQALIGIRRTDDSHIAAVSTLLVLLVVLLVRDVVRDPPPRAAWGGIASAVAAAAGAGWVLAALISGFRVESRFAIVLLCAVCLVGVVLARNGDRPWASTGALGALAGLLVVGLIGWPVSQVRADEAGQREVAIAEAVRDDVDRCVGPQRRAWVVPGPLGLYDELDLENPTPFVLFWYTFEAETERVVTMIERGEIPAIIQVGGLWPDPMHRMVPVIEQRFERCATHEGPPAHVDIWVRR